jgi:hypothetical protein
LNGSTAQVTNFIPFVSWLETLASFCEGIAGDSIITSVQNTSISAGRMEQFKIPHKEKLRQYYYDKEMCDSAMGMIIAIIQHTRIYGMCCYKSPKKSATTKP